MKSIVSGTDMKKVDNYTINSIGIPSMVLMERAALCVTDLICKNESVNKSVLIIAGTGNNGADGLAIGRMLYLRGYSICIYILGDEKKASNEFKQQYNINKKLSIELVNELTRTDVIVDAIFGVGLSREPKGEYADTIEFINNSNSKIYSVDIPSGVCANTGKSLGCAVKADYTVTFGFHKIGTVLYPGKEYCGDVVVSDIGFPTKSLEVAENVIKYATKDDLQIIPKRPDYSNKGSFGKVLIVAGSQDISGAACMCALAAFRTGAGLVRVYTHENNREVIQKFIPEAMVDTYNLEKFDKEQLSKLLGWSDVIAVGPGIGVGHKQKEMLKVILEAKLPTVIDADGINNISECAGLKRIFHRQVVITPHLGEMSRLMNMPVSDIAADLIGCSKDISSEYGINCILKDARTVIASDDSIYINLTGNSGMATAGSGDVLTGILIGLIGIGMNFDLATVMAPFIHGLAGDLAAAKISKTGLMATDIINELKNILF